MGIRNGIGLALAAGLLATAAPGQAPGVASAARPHRSPPEARRGGSHEENVRTVWEVLDLVFRKRKLSHRAGARAIVALEAPGVEAVMGVLWGERPKDAKHDVRDFRRGLAGLSKGRRDFLERALIGFGNASIVPFCQARMAEKTPTEQRLRAIWLIGRVGRGANLPHMLTLILRIPPTHLVVPHIDAHIKKALNTILQKDGGTLRHLGKGWFDLPAYLQKALIPAIGESRSPEAARFLAGLLGKNPKYTHFDARLLDIVGEIGSKVPGADDDLTLRTVRKMLDAPDEQRKKAAIQAVGRLHDAQSFPALIELLGDERASVRNAAHHSLRKLSGKKFAPDKKQWKAWYKAELAWLEDNRDKLREDLTGEVDSGLIQAMRSLGDRRLFREEFVGPLNALIEESNVPVQRIAAITMSRLGSLSFVETLIEVLDDAKEPLVRTSVHKALSAITGKRLPSEAAAWKAAFPHLY